MVPTIPPKDAWERIEGWDDIPDIMGILDCFDPSVLTWADKREFASRNPYETDFYRDEYGTPIQPIEHRLRSSEFCAKRDREELEILNKQFLEAVSGYLHGYEDNTTLEKPFKKVRQHLIKAIGTKATEYIVRSEYESRSPDEWDDIAAAYQNYVTVRKEAWEEARRLEEESQIDYWYKKPVASVHEKVVMIRKGFKGSNGKPLTQRNFAKLLEYPINKYVEAEKTDRHGREEYESPVEEELLEKLVMIVHANPYWLFDSDCEALLAEHDPNKEVVRMYDAPCVYAAPDIILKWIKEGKPKKTHWEDGVVYILKSE